MSNGILYTVQTQRGTVYAVQNISTGIIWTERSEPAARQLAAEQRITLTQEQSVSHEELLRLMGHEFLALKASTTGKTSAPDPALAFDPAPPAEPQKTDDAPAAAAATPLFSSGIPVRYHWEDEDETIAPAEDAIVVPRSASPPVKSVFCSEGLVADSISPAPAIVKNWNDSPQNKPPPAGG